MPIRFSLALLLSFLLVRSSWAAAGALFVAPVHPDEPQQVRLVQKLIKERGLRSVLFMKGSSQGLKEALTAFEEVADRPLLTFLDAEWGVGMRLLDQAPWPRNLTLGAVQDLSLLEEYGLQLARECRQLGVMGNFAPVVDVLHELENPALGVRCFSDDPSEVARRGGAISAGMERGGVLSCAKHFPGHGATEVDSHLELPVLRHLELSPFHTLIERGVSMVMVGHLVYPPLSSLPASLSPEIITTLLKEDLGFSGVVASDALNMKALSDIGSFEESCERAFLAGCDLLLSSTGSLQRGQFLLEEAIPRAIDWMEERGLECEIRERLKRVDRLAERDLPPLPTDNPSLRSQLYRAALTKVGEFPPLFVGQKLVVATSRPDSNLANALAPFADVEFCPLEEGLWADVICLRKGDLHIAIPTQPIVVLFDAPFVLPQNPTLVAYEDVPEVKEAVAEALFGVFAPPGKLPIRVSRGYGWKEFEREGQVRCDLEGAPLLPGL